MLKTGTFSCRGGIERNSFGEGKIGRPHVCAIVKVLRYIWILIDVNLSQCCCHCISDLRMVDYHVICLLRGHALSNRLIYFGSLLEPQDIEYGRGSAEAFELQLP